MKNGTLFFAVNGVLSVLLVVFTLCVALPLSSGWEQRLCGKAPPEPAAASSKADMQTEAAKTTVKPAEDGTSARETETSAPPANSNSAELSDIKAMQEEYIAAFADMEPYGSVSEQFFETNGATDIIGRVAVKNTTESQTPDFEALLKEGAPLQKADFSKPTVLVFHTHTTESYLQVDDGVFYKDYETRSTDPGRNMVRVGNELCAALEERGIGVIHDTNIYDNEYDGAYRRSRETVLDYLEKYPEIQVVLDVHRDAIYYSETSRCKPTAVINGEKAAQVMIITGAQDGQITDFPGWEENLKFALSLQKTAQDMYKGLMKPVFFCPRKYNMDTAECSLLLEIGSDANTLEEACRSARMLGEALAELILNTEAME